MRINKRALVRTFVPAMMLVMALIAACGSPGGGGGGGAPATDTAPATADTAATGNGAATPATGDIQAGGPLDPFSETVTLNLGLSTHAGQNFFDDDTWEDNRWTRRIYNDLNIAFEIAFTADTTVFGDMLRLRLATADLPDIFYTYDRLLFHEAQRAGLIQPIGDVLRSHGTAPVQEYITLFPESFAGASVDGIIYGFPVMNDNFHTGHYIWIRDDWLENTNSQPPVTLDDFINLARTFTFEDPNNDGSRTFGFAFYNPVTWNMAALLGAHGVPSGWGGVFYHRDGNLTHSFIQPEVRDVLEIINYFHREGIIDPEFIVKDMSILETDIARGVVGMFDYRNWGTWYPFNLVFEADGVITRPYPIPVIPGVDFKVGVANNAGGGLHLLSSNVEHPEAFVKIINLFNYLTFESTDPANFDRYWSEGMAGLVPVRPIVPNEIYAPEIHEAMRMGSGDHLPAAIRPFFDFVYAFETGADRSGQAFGTWGQMFERGSMAIALYDYRNAGALVQNVMGAELPEVWLHQGEILETMVETAFTEFIVGTRSLDQFDQFVEDWLANGGQETLEQLQIIYEAAQ